MQHGDVAEVGHARDGLKEEESFDGVVGEEVVDELAEELVGEGNDEGGRGGVGCADCFTFCDE